MNEIQEPAPDFPGKVVTQGAVLPTDHDIWFWPRLLARLDKAGLAIVRKPILTERGRPTKRPM